MTTADNNPSKYSHVTELYNSVAVWAALYLVIAGSFQYIISFPLDDDTAYHAFVGQLISKHGILQSFPWTPFTWLSDHYADKDLLFHLLFVPLVNLGWVTAAKIVGTICGASILLTTYLILRTEKIKYAGLWALVPLTGSVVFLDRFVLVRPLLISITLVLIFLWAALRGRLKTLAIVSLLFPWAYVAFWQIPCLLLLAVETARLLSGERVRWKPSAVSCTCIAVGLALHPNAANLLNVNMMEMVDLLFKHSWNNKVGFEAIGELGPYPLAGWIQGLMFIVIMLIVAAIISWRKRHDDNLALAFTIAAAGFCILTIKSIRFNEYFVPLSVVAMALSSRYITWRLVPHVIIAVTISWFAWVQPNTFSDWSKRPDYMPQPIASFLNQKIPPGTLIFNTNWDLAGWLMLALPDRRFIVALDPTFLYKKEPEIYRIWYQLCNEAPAGSAHTIRRVFGAKYVLGFNRPNSKKLFDQLSLDPSVRELVSTDTWVLFDLYPH